MPDSKLLSGASAGDQPGIWHVLVCGLDLESSPLSVGPTITIRRLDEPLSVFDLANAGVAGFREWAVLEPLAGSAKCEIESPRDAAVIPGYDALNRAWLATALILLRGFDASFCPAASGYSWNRIAGITRRNLAAKSAGMVSPEESLPKFIGGLLDFHLKTIRVVGADKRGFMREDAEWVSEHFEAFNSLAAKSPAFNFALQAATDWRFIPDLRSAVSRLWAGIESLFGQNTELSFKISTMAASLLTARGPERYESFKLTKKSYDARSRAVHGDKMKPEELSKAVLDSFSLLRRLLMAMIQRGSVPSRAEYERLIFE